MEVQEVSTSDNAEAVKTAPKGNYNSVRDDVEKPFNERQKVPSVRSGLTVHRKYHSTDGEITSIIEKHKAMGGGSVVNPHSNRNGVSYAQVQSLINLGADVWHSHKSVKDMMEKIMLTIPKKIKQGGEVVETDAWTHFQGKASRDGAVKPKDIDGKIIQNFRVLQRIPRADGGENNPYGLKLAQFKMCIDIDYKEVVPGVDPIPHFRLNTQWKDENVSPMYNKPKRAKREKVLKVQD